MIAFKRGAHSVIMISRLSTGYHGLLLTLVAICTVIKTSFEIKSLNEQLITVELRSPYHVGYTACAIETTLELSNE